MFKQMYGYMYKEVPEVSPPILDWLIGLSPIIPSQQDGVQVPLCTIPDVDVTRVKEAFGRPKLRYLLRQLFKPDIGTARIAINRLTELVHDPEKCFEAIQMDMVGRLQHLCGSQDVFLRERSVMIMCTLAQMDLGRVAILNNLRAVDNLKALLADPNLLIRLKVSETLEILALNMTGAMMLIEAGFLSSLLDRIRLEENSNVMAVTLSVLRSLLQLKEGHRTLDKGALLLFAGLSEHGRGDIRAAATACTALLAVHPEGKTSRVPVLNNVLTGLSCEDPAEQAQAAAIVMNVTSSSEFRLPIFKLGLHNRLLVLAANCRDRELQINCVKALTNLAEVPEARAMLQSREAEVRAIPVAGEDAEAIRCHVQTLLNIIHFQI